MFDKVEIVKVALGHQCNLACDYCSDRLSKWKTNTFSDYTNLTAWLKMLPKLRMVTLYGGEPFLQDVENAVRELRAVLPNLNICVFTNGMLFNDQIGSLIRNNRLSLNITFSSYERSQSRRVLHTGESSYDIVKHNLPGLINASLRQTVIVDTLLYEDVEHLSESIIGDFEYSDYVELNMVRSYGELGNIPVLSRELSKVVDYLVLNRDKCLKNFSKNFPKSPAFFRDVAAFKQGTYTDYVNGLKNVLVDVDGMIYPSTSHAGRGLSMGSIYGDVNQSMYDQFSTARDDCDCYLKKMCVPNYEHFNPDGVALPFKGTSHCDYFQAIYEAMYSYYRRLEGKSV